MATSTIKTGLRLAKLDSTKFTWHNNTTSFQYSLASAIADTGLSTVVTWYVTSNTSSGVIFGLNIINNGNIRVMGWVPKIGANITSDIDTTWFTVYAIGY